VEVEARHGGRQDIYRRHAVGKSSACGGSAAGDDQKSGGKSARRHRRLRGVVAIFPVDTAEDAAITIFAPDAVTSGTLQGWQARGIRAALKSVV